MLCWGKTGTLSSSAFGRILREIFPLIFNEKILFSFSQDPAERGQELTLKLLE